MRMRQFLVFPLFLVVQSVCSDTGDLRGLVDVLTEQQTQLKVTIDALRTEFNELTEKYGTLLASVTAQRHEKAQWQRETAAHLESLVAGRRLSSAVLPQGRGLSSDTCADLSDPALRVEGVCSCTKGLLVEGRNVTKELDQLASFHNSIVTSIPSVSVTTEAFVADPCTTSHRLQVVGSITDDSYNMDGAWSVAISRDGKYAYVTGETSDSLAVVNVSNATSATVVGSIVGDSRIMDRDPDVVVSPNSSHVYVIGYLSHSFAVINVEDPKRPFVVGSIEDDTTNLYYPTRLAVTPDGAYAVVAVGERDGITIVDIEIPSSPSIVGKLLGDLTNMCYPIGIAVSPNSKYVYVTGYSEGVAVVDISDVTQPQLVGSIIGQGYISNGVVISPDGAHLYVVGGTKFITVDVSNPTNPTVVVTITLDSSSGGPSISPDGRYIFVVNSFDGLYMIDVQNITHPKVVGNITGDSVNMGNSFRTAVSPNDNFVYVTGKDSDSVALIQWQDCSSQ